MLQNVNDETELHSETEELFSPWSLSEPNGQQLENCIAVTLSDRAFLWADKSCFDKTCTFCDLKISQTYILRGTERSCKGKGSQLSLVFLRAL